MKKSKLYGRKTFCSAVSDISIDSTEIATAVNSSGQQGVELSAYVRLKLLRSAWD